MYNDLQCTAFYSFSNIMEMRKQHKDAFLKKHNVKLGFMSAFVKASTHALQDIAVVNAGIYHHFASLSIRPYCLVLKCGWVEGNNY
jgi:pyruvate/2-oxoglutarate dehydrogenase complex dihydrolipoamide acyltransferase (E2) component